MDPPEKESSGNLLIGQAELDDLHQVVDNGPVLILTHNNPDPDALASGKALATLFRIAWNVSSDLYYAGMIARAENQAVLAHLTPEWERHKILEGYEKYTAIALVDTQPLAGNNSLPESQTADIVIDHHNPLRNLKGVRFLDIRPYIGATVTIVYQYLEAAGIQPDPDLATAMFYGLKTDTRGLSRGTSALDEATYLKLLNYLDRQALVRVEQAGLPQSYFQAFGHGLHVTEVCGKAVFTYLGKLTRPDLAAEIADLLIRLENAQAALCLGYFGKTLHLSLRTKNGSEDAGMLVQKIVISIGKAGGHGNMAGGQISLKNRNVDSLVKIIKQRYLDVLGENESVCKPLLNS
jgi:nanoRNase/pAp phosphatase (c-di-AMP/oligoRNAs hydrolase)